MAEAAEPLFRGEEEAVRVALSLRTASLVGVLARDAVLARGAVPALLPHLHPHTPPRVLLPAVQALSNLCRHTKDEPAVRLELVSPALPLLVNLLDDGDPHVLEAACAVVVNLTYCGKSEYINAVQSMGGLTERLMALLEHEATAVRRPALTAVANLLAGNTTQVERCLEAGCLDHVVPLLRSSDAFLVQHAARAAANMFVHTSATKKALEKNILHQLENVLEHTNYECQKQAAKAIGNICYYGTAEIRKDLVLSRILRPYCTALTRPDHTMAKLVLHGLEALVQDAEEDAVDDACQNCSGTKEEVKFLYTRLVEANILDSIQQLLQKQDIDENLRRQAQELSVAVRWVAHEEVLIIEDGTIYTPTMIIKDLKYGELARQVKAARAARKILRKASIPGPERLTNVSDTMAEYGIFKLLLAALDDNVCPELQLEAAWVFVYVTFVNRHAVEDTKGILKLVALLAKEGQVAIPAAYALGNLATIGRTSHNEVVQSGAVESLQRLLHPETPLEYLIAFLSAYKGLCAVSKYDRNIPKLTSSLPYLPQLLDMSDHRVLVLVCGALENLMMKSDEGTRAVFSTPELASRLTSLIVHEADEVQVAALKAVKSMFKRAHFDNEKSIAAACLFHVMRLLGSHNPVLVKEAASLLKKLLFVTHYFVILAMDNDVLTPLLNLLSSDELEYRMEAVQIIVGLSEHDSQATRERLVSRGVVQHCNSLLAERDRMLGEHPPRHHNSLFQDLTDNVCRILGGITLHSTGIDAVLDEPELTPRLLMLLGHETVNVQTKAYEVLKSSLGVDTATEAQMNCCISHLVNLLQSTDPVVVERGARATWVIICKSSEIQVTLTEAVFPPLLDVLADGELNCQVEAARAISIMCVRGSAYMTSSTVLERCNALLATRHATPAPDAPASSKDLAQELTKQVVLLVRCVMMYFEGGTDAVQAESGLTGRLVTLLGHEAPKLQEAALMAVIYMLNGTDTQAKHCVDHIVPLLRSDRPALVEGAARAMGEVFAGTQSQIQMALDTDVLSPLLNVLDGGELECQVLAVQAVTEFCRCGSPAQRELMVSRGVLAAYCGLLARPGLPAAAVEDVLNGLDWLLQIEHADFNGEALRSQLKEMCVRAELDKLTQHEDETVKREADKLLKKYVDL